MTTELGRGGGPTSSSYAWSFVMSGGQAIATTITTFVVAAIVGPEPFGVIAMALVYVTFVQMLVQQGLGSAIVQRSELTPTHVQSAFAMLCGVTVLLTVASILGAGWWADVNDLPALRDVIVVMSALLPIRAMIVIPEALLRRRLEFRSLAIRTNIGAFCGAIVGVVSALLGAGVWALVAQQLVSAAFEMVVVLAMAKWVPRFRLDLGAARDLFGFSAGSFLASLAAFLHARADALVMGLFFGPVAVGIYRFAYRMVFVFLDVVQRAVGSVTLATLSACQADLPAFRLELRRVYRIAATVTLPVLGVIVGCAGVLVELVGPEWNSAVPIVRLLCLQGAGAALTFMTGPVLQSLGRPHRFAAMSWASGAVALLSFVAVGAALRDASTTTQVVGVGMVSALLYGGVFLYVYVRAATASCALPLRDVWDAARGPLLVGATAALTGSAVDLLLRWRGVPTLAAGAATVVASLAAAGVTAFLATPDIFTLAREAVFRGSAGPTPAASTSCVSE